MLAIVLDLLAGRYVATEYNDRERAEWPPHPARLFSAMVAAWADTDADAADPEERAALEWLAQQDAPDILASAQSNVGHRAVAPHFVPVNDASIVAQPDRMKLDVAMDGLSAATDLKSRAKYEKEVSKLNDKLIVDTAKATAASEKVGKNEVAAALGLFAERRTRKPRTFPSVTPETPEFAFVWEHANGSEATLNALDRILSRLVRLGHSSSLVFARRVETPSLERLSASTERLTADDENGNVLVRWVRHDQLERLMDAFSRHHETDPRILPACFVRYRAADRTSREEVAESIFDDELVVLKRIGGPRLPITSVAGLSRQVRRILMSYSCQPVPELLSGHKLDGSPSKRPHLAILPLPVVGADNADGAIVGLALAFPRACAEEERRAVLSAVSLWEESHRIEETGDAPPVLVRLASTSTLELQRHVWGLPGLLALQNRRWSRPSRRWATATPIALDRNPGDLHHPNSDTRKHAFDAASRIVAEAVARVLPTNGVVLINVEVFRSCLLPGTAKPRSHPRYPFQQDRPQRVLVHAYLEFERPVRGPLIVGAGRYQGLGLCVPLDDRFSPDDGSGRGEQEAVS